MPFSLEDAIQRISVLEAQVAALAPASPQILSVSQNNDVHVGSVVPLSDGQVLVWDATEHAWVNGSASSSSALPIIDDDGTNKVTIRHASHYFDILLAHDSDPTHPDGVFEMEPGGTFDIQAGKASDTSADVNLSASHDFNVIIGNDINLLTTTQNGNPGRDINVGAVGDISIGASGNLFLGLPTSDPGVSGATWNDGGVVTVSP